MKINVDVIKREIDSKFFGNIKLFEEISGLGGVNRILRAGKCSSGAAFRICSALHIPFWKMWE